MVTSSHHLGDLPFHLPVKGSAGHDHRPMMMPRETVCTSRPAKAWTA